jgi:hypothetical protein
MSIKDALLTFFNQVIESRTANAKQIADHSALTELFDRDAENLGRRRRIIIQTNSESLH